MRQTQDCFPPYNRIFNHDLSQVRSEIDLQHCLRVFELSIVVLSDISIWRACDDLVTYLSEELTLTALMQAKMSD